ncbi:uncharacterized protein TM35_000023130 [Trypanosoma theileri]|uniref:SET domain-containing protein n=1 Tax=Trypanosoma theileri TaxID=67003 RepID=A0A1X0P7R4_9TRYP|nr:uncharacterized protein TM35_000023130 [Trypanosoma theileri]ORC92987.1 hypothetical protein TM35_000023130 [Trypanosoma theileri]
MPSSVISQDDSYQTSSYADPIPQSVRLDSEEAFALQLWISRIRYSDESNNLPPLYIPTESSSSSSSLKEKTTQLTLKEEKVKEIVPFGPALPPGWYMDVNDPVLLTYDPYFGTHTAGTNVMAAPIFTAKEGRYYANDALPLCRVGAHSLKSHPPEGLFMKSAESGPVNWMHPHSFVAQRSIHAGEVIAMDVSELSIVEDSLVWRFLPPPSFTYRMQMKKYDNKTNNTNNKNIYIGKSETHTVLSSSKLANIARQIVLRANSLQNGKVRLIETGYAQFISSFIISYGDLELLPVNSDINEHLLHLGLCDKSPFTVRSKTLRRSQIAEKFIEKWCTSLEDMIFLNKELRETSLLLLQCIPPVLLDCMQKDATAVGGCLFLNNRNDTLVMLHCGFFRRMGLHQPDRLARLLWTFSRYAIPIQVPDLPMRSGCFPFLRLIPHECRPNSFIMFLDSPASHCYGKEGFFNYNTVSTRYDNDNNNNNENNNDNNNNKKKKELLPWGSPCSDRIFLPSVAVLVACRDITKGECIYRSFFGSSYMTQPQRLQFLKYFFCGIPNIDKHIHTGCSCRWCVKELDYARAFRCPKCPRDCGVICPPGDCSRLDEWICLQCGYHPNMNEIHLCLDEEQELSTVKADKTSGLVRLLQANYVHYSHALVFRKIDTWCQKAWQEHDASMCLEYLDIMHKSVHRVLNPCDPQLAQVHEFTAQVNHAVGSAHTARYEYFLALQIRLRAGMRYAHWTRKTWFMAAEKSLAEFLDSV